MRERCRWWIRSSATVGTSPALFTNLGYDPRKDFEPIGLIAATPNLIAVHPTFPAQTLAEWIKIGQETREPIPYGSPGTGTLNHLTVELIAHRLGIGRTTAWQRWTMALLKISVRLNADSEQNRPDNKIVNKRPSPVLERL